MFNGTSSNPGPVTPSQRTLPALLKSSAHTVGFRRKAATTAAALLALTMGYHVVFGHNGLTAFQQKRDDERSLQQQMDALDRENARIRLHVERLQKNDPSAIEYQAREQLHYTRPGEVIYTLPPDKPATTPRQHP